MMKLLVLSALLLPACSDLDVPDLNRPSLSDLQTNPTPAGIAAAVGGAFDGIRRNAGFLVSNLGAYGREGWNLDPSNPQNINNVIVQLDPDAASGYWVQTYANFRTEKVALAAVDAVGSQLTDAEKEGIRGILKTLKAYELTWAALVYDDSGVALDVNTNPADPLSPIVTKQAAFAEATKLYDEALAHLQKAGNSFAVAVPTGFSAFSTPAEFAKLNRGLKARQDVLTGQYAAALTDLAASFLDRSAPLTKGAYNDYSGNAGDFAQPIYDPTTRQRFADQSFLADAKKRADGSVDLRAAAKVAPIPEITRTGITVTEKLTVYNSNTAQIPVIRNEELILLRAEARLKTGDLAGAQDDLNFIRTTSGGLAPLQGTLTADQLMDELLYNRRYSLFWEQGVRWLDARRFNLWNTLPRRQTTTAQGKFFSRLSIPRNECTQRNPTPAGCAAPTPI